MNRHAVEQHQHLFIHATKLDIVPGRVGDGRLRSLHTQTRHVAQQLVKTLRRGVLNFLLRDHRGVQGHIFKTRIAAACRNNDCSQCFKDGGSGRCLLRLRRVGAKECADKRGGNGHAEAGFLHGMNNMQKRFH